MPYLIVFAILIIGAGGFYILQSPDETPVEATATTEEVARIDVAETESDDDPEDEVEPVPSADTTPLVESADVAEVVTETPEVVEAVDPVPTGTTGVFSGESSYSTGRDIHELFVTLTLDNDIVVNADIQYDGSGEPQTPMLRSFNEAYEVEVIGKDIDDIELSRVGGASWTSDAYNEAVDEIRDQAS